MPRRTAIALMPSTMIYRDMYRYNWSRWSRGYFDYLAAGIVTSTSLHVPVHVDIELRNSDNNTQKERAALRATHPKWASFCV